MKQTASKIISLLILFIFCSCQNFGTKSQELDKFIAPKLIDEIPFFNSPKISNEISISYYPILGVYPFTKEVRINENDWNPFDTSIKKLEPLVSDGLQILIDTTQKLTISEDTIDLAIDKNKQVIYLAYPCFIYNETKSTKWLHCQDGDLVATLEALDSNYRWRPIEVWMWPWCGNSKYRIPIKPNHFALTKIPVFHGDYKTELRLKIYSSDVLYYSKTYESSINYSQFNKPKELTDKYGNFKRNIDFIEIRKTYEDR